MWTRAELKERAKATLKRNYVPCILISLILLFAMGSQQSATVAVGNSGGSRLDTQIYNSMYQTAQTYLLGPTQVLWNNIEIALGGLAGIVCILLKIFVFNPIEVGGCRFFMENTVAAPSVGKAFEIFKSEYYRNVVLTLFIRDIKLILWGALFVFPAIIKYQEYRCVPYLLAQNPGMNQQDAFFCSRSMMYGEKMNAFILDLSFLLWEILSSFTFGLLGIFFVNPYHYATNAELFMTLKQKGTSF